MFSHLTVHNKLTSIEAEIALAASTKEKATGSSWSMMAYHVFYDLLHEQTNSLGNTAIVKLYCSTLPEY